jgi:hypothetical protein
MKRTYVRYSEQWYAQPVGEPEFVLRQRDPQLEVIVSWPLARLGIAAHIEIYDQSWQAFALWPDLFATLAALADEGGGMAADFACSPDEFEAVLKELGFEESR